MNSLISICHPISKIRKNMLTPGLGTIWVVII